MGVVLEIFRVIWDAIDDVTGEEALGVYSPPKD
jgi:hypothetical protein